MSRPTLAATPPPLARRAADVLLVVTAASVPLSTTGEEAGLIALAALTLVAVLARWAVVRRTPLDGVLGIWLSAGSEGVYASLRELVQAERFDLVLACDVGGDFIASPENRGVLSPMMDGYALHALRRHTSSRFARLPRRYA